MSNPHADRRGPKPAHVPLTAKEHAARWTAHIERLAARDTRRATHSAPATHEAWNKHLAGLHARSKRSGGSS